MPWKIFIALNMAKNLANEFPTGTPVLPSLKASTKEDAFICYVSLDKTVTFRRVSVSLI